MLDKKISKIFATYISALFLEIRGCFYDKIIKRELKVTKIHREKRRKFISAKKRKKLFFTFA